MRANMRSLGTSTLVIVTSCEPEPESPPTFHVSRISKSGRVTTAYTAGRSGITAPLRRRCTSPANTPALWQPLTNCQRPFTRNPRAVSSAVQIAAVEPHRIVNGSASSSAHSTNAGAIRPKLSMPIMRFQPVLPSAVAAASIVAICVIGSHSVPPTRRGAAIRYKPASRHRPRNRRAASGGRVRWHRRAGGSTAPARARARRDRTVPVVAWCARILRCVGRRILQQRRIPHHCDAAHSVRNCGALRTQLCWRGAAADRLCCDLEWVRPRRRFDDTAVFVR